MPETQGPVYPGTESTPSDSHSDVLTGDGTARRVIVPMRGRSFQLAFDGKEVTEFLDDYDRMTDNAGLSDDLKVRVLPDYCEEHCRRFVKRLKPYAIGNWIELQQAMKEHWKDQDTSQNMGTRAFLEAFVEKTSQSFPGLSDYYTNFVVYCDACQRNRQILAVEEGYFFFRGLPKADKDLVLFNMPDGPVMSDRSSFDLEKIYQFVRRVHEQRRGLKESSYGKEEIKAMEARYLMDSTREPPDYRRMIEQAKDQFTKQPVETKKPLPAGVDDSVEELVKAMEGWKLQIAEVGTLMDTNDRIREILRSPTNYAYFIAHATKAGELSERNDGSYISNSRQNVDPSRGVSYFQGREYNNTCHMCGEPNHRERDCELYKALVRMGWCSYRFDEDTKRRVYYYGPVHCQLDPVKGPMPPTYRLNWLKQRIQEYFEVSQDVLDQPASAVKPDRFRGVDSRPRGTTYGNSQNAQSTQRSSQPARTDGTVSTLTTMEGPDAQSDALAAMQNFRLLDSDHGEVMSLDYIDGRDIVLGAYAEQEQGAVNAATRSQKAQAQPVDKVLERARNGTVQKQKTVPVPCMRQGTAERVFDEARDELAPESRSRTVTEEPGPSFRPGQDSSTLPFPSQPHNRPYAIVKPPSQGTTAENIPASIQKKKRPQGSALDNEELVELLQPGVNKIPTAILLQEVRGLTVGDLVAQKSVQALLQDVMKSAGSEGVRSGSVNVVNLTADAAGQSEVTRCDLTTSDWPNNFDVRASAALSSTNAALAYTSSRSYPADPNPPCLQLRESCNLVSGQGAQIQHRVSSNEDSWQDIDPPNEIARTMSETRSERVVHQELPTCWAQIGQHGVNCLIDTGA